MRIELDVEPFTHADWWRARCSYSKFNRQGVDIVCASFLADAPRANVFIVPAWNETFLRYSDLVRELVERGFNVHTYDHQGQGFSERWTSDQELAWVHSFDDYGDDLAFFITSVCREGGSAQLPVFALAQGLGALVAAVAMSRNPTLVARAVLVSPLFRSRFRVHLFGQSFHVPEPIAYWSASLLCLAGLGAMPSLLSSGGEPRTSDDSQRRSYERLQQQYPSIVCTWFTNDWIRLCVLAQRKFARRYQFVKAPCLLLCAGHDAWAHNRAVAEFAAGCGCSQVAMAPCLHDLLFESTEVRGAAAATIEAFFAMSADAVLAQSALVVPPFTSVDPSFAGLSVPEKVVRGACLVLASIGTRRPALRIAC